MIIGPPKPAELFSTRPIPTAIRSRMRSLKRALCSPSSAASVRIKIGKAVLGSVSAGMIALMPSPVHSCSTVRRSVPQHLSISLTSSGSRRWTSLRSGAGRAPQPATSSTNPIRSVRAARDPGAGRT
jgi:hypothetical protein